MNIKTCSRANDNAPGWARPSRRRGHWARWILPGVVVLLVWVMGAASAFALTKEELFKLKEQKVPDTVVVTVVKGSGPMNLTSEDVKNLSVAAALNKMADRAESDDDQSEVSALKKAAKDLGITDMAALFLAGK